MVRTSVVVPLKAKAVVRETTCSPSTLASALISSSVIPSAKNSFSGSGLRLVKGNTAIERGRLGCAGAAGRSAVVSGDRTSGGDQEVRHRVEAGHRLARQRAPQRLVQRRRHFRPMRLQARRRLGEAADQRLCGRVAGERRLAREHLVEHAARARRCRSARRPRARRPPARDSCRRACPSDEPGLASAARSPAASSARAIPKSATTRLALVQQDVLGLDVAVHHAAAGGRNRARAPTSRAIRSASSSGQPPLARRAVRAATRPRRTA